MLGVLGPADAGWRSVGWLLDARGPGGASGFREVQLGDLELLVIWATNQIVGGGGDAGGGSVRSDPCDLLALAPPGEALDEGRELLAKGTAASVCDRLDLGLAGWREAAGG